MSGRVASVVGCVALALMCVSAALLPLEANEAIAPAENLFNGRDLSGWKAIGSAIWEVKDGVLIGRQGANNQPGDLMSTAEFDNFELAVVWKMIWPGNSGVWYRYQSDKKAYQADILEYKEPVAYAGSLYCTGKMFLARNTNSKLIRQGDWNTLVIRCVGDRHTVDLNGSRVAEVRDSMCGSGRIGFQVHAGREFRGMQIFVREVKLRRLQD